MKPLILTATLVFLFSTDAYCLCAVTTGNCQFSISNDAKAIPINALNAKATLRTAYVDPALVCDFAGLVFGMKESDGINISLLSEESKAPFNMDSSGPMKEKGVEGFWCHFQSYRDKEKPHPILSKDWTAVNWNTITVIPDSGSLDNDSSTNMPNYSLILFYKTNIL